MITETEKFIVDAKTGETVKIQAGTKIISPEEIEYRRDFMRRKKELDLEKYLKNKSLEQYGQFVWHIYKIAEPYNLQLKPATITRLIYLATYLDTDGSIVDYEQPYGKKIYLKKEDISKCMNLNRKTFSRFFKEIQDKKILMEYKGRWYLSKKIFDKGSIPDKEIAVLSGKGHYIIRMYKKAIREIYLKSKVTSHPTLGYLFQIIPFVNREYNIVCFNPLETDINKIKCMTVSDYCRAIGYCENSPSKIFNLLWNLEFTTERGKECAVAYVSNKSVQKGNFFIYINPYVYYAGSHWDKVEILGAFTKEENNKTR